MKSVNRPWIAVHLAREQFVPNDLITALVYISTASPGLKREDLLAIENTAQNNNQRYNITGLLAFNGTNFIQLIEGAQAAVNECAYIVQSDTRHSGMSILSKDEFAHRQFPDWNMACCFLGDGKLNRAQQFRELLGKPSVHKETRELFLSFHSLGLPK